MPFRTCFFLLFVFWILPPVTATAQSEVPVVVTTIRPLHSIAARVMLGASEPQLLIAAGASPHTISLKPSQRKRLDAADIVLWIGPALEGGFEKAISQLPSKTIVLSGLKLPNMALLPVREEIAKHDDEKHEDEKDHGHDSDGQDVHLWLDPDNAVLIAKELANALSERDPKNAERYQSNATDFSVEMHSAINEVEAAVKPVSKIGFLTLHDGFQYFEKRFGVESKGSVLIDPQRSASARHIKELQSRIKAERIHCLLTEPEFPNRIVNVLTTSTKLKTREIDILGSKLDPGPNLYADLIRGLGKSVRECLTN